MTHDEKVYETPVTIKIELTGNEAHALGRVGCNHPSLMSADAAALIDRIQYEYEQHISYNPITPEED